MINDWVGLNLGDGEGKNVRFYCRYSYVITTAADLQKTQQSAAADAC